MREREITPRKNSVGVAGGGFGDEGKGRIVDGIVDERAKQSQVDMVIIDRVNGGANAGHTIEVGDKRIALHQIPSGCFTEKATLVLGKGMVINPGDLVTELRQVTDCVGSLSSERIWIDEKAILALDTHRAFEQALKGRGNVGSIAATGRGIAPAYADYYLRTALQIRDLTSFSVDKMQDHYKYYEKIIHALTGIEMSQIKVPSLLGEFPVGTFEDFMNRLQIQREILAPYCRNVIELLRGHWSNKRTAFVFEMAQAVGLDPWFGVYPDVTSSRTGFETISDSTEGVVDQGEIQYRAGVIKATYMSTVGTRKLPTPMEEGRAKRIRTDFNEFGATTGRPRGIVYLDMEALRFFARVGKFNCLVLTHMDSVYPDVPIKVCIGYRDRASRRITHYSPDQITLDKVEPVYRKFRPWNKEAVQKARNYDELPPEAKTYLSFVSEQLELPIWMITTGPKRKQGITFENV